MHPKNWKKKLFRNKSLCSLLLMACVVNAEPEEEKVISIDCKDKRNQTVNLEIDLNSNQFKATKKNKVITKGKIIKATTENNNLEFKLVPLENSKSKDFGSGALINGLKC